MFLVWIKNNGGFLPVYMLEAQSSYDSHTETDCRMDGTAVRDGICLVAAQPGVDSCQTRP